MIAYNFKLYASRVKHVVFKSTPQSSLISRTLPSFPTFPHLKHAVIQGDGCLLPPQFLLSPSLQDLDVDLRGTRNCAGVRHRSHQLAETLCNVSSLMTTLQKLRIKGFMATTLDHIIPSFASLRSLTLLTSSSLSVDTLAALGELGNLQDLYVHASNLDADDFTQAISLQTSQPFPVLHNLRIRAQRSLFCAILDVIPSDTLRSLYLETEESAQGPSAWNPTFTLIAAKASNTLIDVTLDQILDPEELESNLTTSGADTRFAIETLQPLGKLRALRRLTIDAMLLPDFTDRDIDQMASWWTQLEHLDLGGLPDGQDHAEVPKITTAALRALAKRCPRLRSLSIPLDSASCSQEPCGAVVVQQKALERLVVGPPPADEHVAAFVRSVIHIFPCVREIECASADKSLSVDVQGAGRAHALDVEHPKGTSDGFANGQ